MKMPSSRSFAILLLLAVALCMSACGGKKHRHGAADGGDDATVTDGGDSDASDAKVDSAVPIEPSLEFVEYGMPIDITPNGRTALIQDSNSEESDLYFYDTVTHSLVKKTTVGPPEFSFATGISSNLRISALHGDPVMAGVWNEGEGWQDFANPFEMGCDHNEGGAWDISADGNVVVGFSWNVCSPSAFRSVDNGTALSYDPLELVGEPFEESVTPVTNRPTVVSDDGLVAAGFAQFHALDRTAAVWTADGEGVLLFPTEEETPSEILAINTDGTILAGTWGLDAFSWTAEGGRVDLGKLETSLPSDSAFPNAISRNGALIFGTIGDFFSKQPFVWTEAHGMRSVSDILAELQIIMPVDVILTGVIAASEDGTVILGTAVDGFTAKTFVLRLPVSAYGL